MKIRILYFVLLVAALCGCTQNDGMIGSWFGTWALDRIEINGTEVEPDGGGDTFFSFHTSVIRICRVKDRIVVDERFGTWDSKDGYLTLDFSHHDDLAPEPGTSQYEPPRWIYFTDIVQRMWMAEKTGRKMILEYGDHTYYLRKTY